MSIIIIYDYIIRPIYKMNNIHRYTIPSRILIDRCRIGRIPAFPKA